MIKRMEIILLLIYLLNVGCNKENYPTANARKLHTHTDSLGFQYGWFGDSIKVYRFNLLNEKIDTIVLK
jgi:hypothetical protein